MKTLRIGITGLRRSGKTVFLTSLINQLLDGGEEAFKAFLDQGVTIGAREDRSTSQPSWLSYEKYLNFFSSSKKQIPRFPYEEHLDAFRQATPHWPTHTTRLSKFRLYVTLQRGTSTQDLLLELVDYPGEQLLDAPLLGQTFEQWSEEAIKEARLGLRRGLSIPWLQACDELTSNAANNKETVSAVVDEYRKYLCACRGQGLTFLQPSAFLLQGEDTKDLDLLFCPLPQRVFQQAEDIARQFAKRYQQYQEQLVKPFCQEVTECDRQVVLVDVLQILKQGVYCFNDTRRALLKILDVYGYTPEASKWSLWALLGLGQTASRVVFVATKADQANYATRVNLERLLQDVINTAYQNLRTKIPHGLSFRFCAANRCTTDARKTLDGQELSCLTGQREDRPHEGEGTWYPGEVPPDWPNDWDPVQHAFKFPNFLPKQLPKRDGATIAHINLDKVFLHLVEDFLP